MAFNGKYVTIDYIKEQARNVLDFEDMLNNYQIAELLWQFLGRIDDPSVLITKVTDGENGPAPIEVVNYRGLLPQDVFHIINHSIRDYNTKIKMIPTNNLYFLADVDEVESVDDTISDDFDFVTRISSGKVGYQHKYMIQNDEIITSMKEGLIEMSYKAFPLDSNGYPMIPEHPKLIEAIKYAILERVCIRLLSRGKITERFYDKIDQKYLFHKASASNALKLRTLPSEEVFKKRFMRLSPDLNQYDNNFDDFGYSEEFYKHSW
jgi:hypothetical protein